MLMNVCNGVFTSIIFAYVVNNTIYLTVADPILLRGNTQYPGALPPPSPNRSQSNAAISASTMVAPR